LDKAEHMQHSSKNGFSRKVIQQIKEKETAKLNERTKKESEEQKERTNKKKWVTFTYYSPLVRKVTNLL
jgi:primosomal protein N'